MDLLRINGIRAYGYVGFYPEEKILGQWFQVDLVIETNFQPAAVADDLDKTVNYVQLIQVTKSTIAEAQVDLIETLASEILNRLLALPRIESVQIQLTKETPPIPDFSGSVTVQMQRSKRSVQRA